MPQLETWAKTTSGERKITLLRTALLAQINALAFVRRQNQFPCLLDMHATSLYEPPKRHTAGTSPMKEIEEGQEAAGHLIHSRVARFWLRELPYIAVLALTLFGVAYTSVSHQPLIGYWEFLAIAIGGVCVTTGWLHIHDPKARFRMVWTQVLHWLAFLVAMNIVLVADVQLTLTATATGLTLLMLLALGTFVAGVHVSWQICVLGIVMGLLVPAIAWLTQSALLLLLVLVALMGIGMTFWWRFSERHAAKAHKEEQAG